MKDNKQQLELTWIGKHNPEYNIANIEPRILQEAPELSNCQNDQNNEKNFSMTTRYHFRDHRGFGAGGTHCPSPPPWGESRSLNEAWLGAPKRTVL